MCHLTRVPETQQFRFNHVAVLCIYLSFAEQNLGSHIVQYGSVGLRDRPAICCSLRDQPTDDFWTGTKPRAALLVLEQAVLLAMIRYHA